MRKIKLVDIEANVLDEQEASEAVALIRSEVGRRTADLESIVVSTQTGKWNGRQIFESAQAFEEKIGDLPLDIISAITKSHVELIDILARMEPELFEYPYLNGKNLLATLQYLEAKVIAKRDRVGKYQNMQRMHSEILSHYPTIEKYLTRASTLFAVFSDSACYEPINFYETRINTYKAMSYRQEAFFALRSAPTLHQALEFEKLRKIQNLIEKSIFIYNNLFQNGIFPDEKSVIITLTGMANSLKLVKSEFNRGLAYYELAQQTFGNQRPIIDGLTFFKIALSGDKEPYRLMHMGLNKFS